MRIGMFSWESLYSISVGGVAAHVSELASALSRLGHEVHIFTRNSGSQKEHEKIPDGVWEHRCIFNGDPDFVQYMDNMCNAMVGCFDYVEDKVGRFDILHAHDWHTVNAMTNLKYGKGYNFIWTCHSTEWGRNGGNFSSSWFSRRISHREWLGGYESSSIITVSGTMKNEIMREYQIPDLKINVIYNGVNPKKFKKKVDPGRIKERYGIWPLDPVVLFVGRVTYQKGPDLLLEAVPEVFKKRQDVKFIFAGGGGDMIDHLKGRAWYLGIQDKIRVLGYVPNDELPDLFNMCDIVCVPSRNEPFGIITLESWSAGKPVVATDIGGPGEIICNFVTGVKVYPTPESIAWGINYLLDSPEGVKWMGKKCEVAVQDFTWDKIAERTMDVYRRFANKR